MELPIFRVVVDLMKTSTKKHLTFSNIVHELGEFDTKTVRQKADNIAWIKTAFPSIANSIELATDGVVSISNCLMTTHIFPTCCVDRSSSDASV